MTSSEAIAHERLRLLYEHWHASRRGRVMPSRADIDPLKIPVSVWPHTMMLDVVHEEGKVRLRYRRVGEVFWQALGREPTGHFVDEILPETAGYRDYVVGIYQQVVRWRCALYTENLFALQGQSVPMLTKRLSLPLSTDGEQVDMILAGHVFEYGPLSPNDAFPLVNGLTQGVRVVLDD